ncbi:MAG: His/Gly/Thr/Pro-type tRNA ligase C-terminal domain-containing protein [Evtepia gabavorous]
MTEDLTAAISFATLLRQGGVRAQVYGEQKKFKGKMSYADKLGIPYVAFLGEDEIAQGVVKIKDMATGEQQTLSPPRRWTRWPPPWPSGPRASPFGRRTEKDETPACPLPAAGGGRGAEPRVCPF